MTPRVSIIIPCFNKAPYVGEAINSALAQSYPNVEVIVVDDGSTDNSLAVIKDYLNKGIKLIQQKNQGVCVARNNAISQSAGEYIVPLDADDILSPVYVQRCIDWFEANPNTKLVYTQCDYFGNRKGSVAIPPYCWDILLWYSIIPATSMFRRIDYDNTCGYNPNMIFALEDWDFYLSLLGPTDVVHLIEEPLLHYRIINSARNNNINSNKEAIFKQIYNNHPGLYAQYTDTLILAHDNWKEYEHLYQGIHKSKAYRLGKAILRPFSKLQSLYAHLR